MCLDSPCLATPKDISKLITAGYGNRLMIGFITPINHEGVESITPARKGWGGTESGAYYYGETSCTFLDRNGLCELHDLGLKPLGGKIANHERTPSDAYILILEKWNSKRGHRIKKKWKERFVKRGLVLKFL